MRYAKLIVSLVVAILCATVFGKDSGAPVQVKGYTRKDGTYVAPHVRSAPNSTKADNYSTKGNVNPYTGKAGTKPADTANSAIAATASAQQSTPAATGGTPAVLPPLSKINLGMTKKQVVAQVGEPNVKGDKSWYYMERGWVRFKGDVVSGIEAK